MKTNLETIASEILRNIDKKPNFSNRDFMNALIIFQSALMDKMYDNQDYDKMDIKDRYEMSKACGNELHKLIYVFTGLNTHIIEDFI